MAIPPHLAKYLREHCLSLSLLLTQSLILLAHSLSPLQCRSTPTNAKMSSCPSCCALPPSLSSSHSFFTLFMSPIPLSLSLPLSPPSPQVPLAPSLHPSLLFSLLLPLLSLSFLLHVDLVHHHHLIILFQTHILSSLPISWCVHHMLARLNMQETHA